LVADTRDVRTLTQLTCILGGIIQVILICASWPGLACEDTHTVHKWACPAVAWYVRSLARRLRGVILLPNTLLHTHSHACLSRGNWVSLLPNRLGICGCGWAYAGIPPSWRPDYVEL